MKNPKNISSPELPAANTSTRVNLASEQFQKTADLAEVHASEHLAHQAESERQAEETAAFKWSQEQQARAFEVLADFWRTASIAARRSKASVAVTPVTNDQWRHRAAGCTRFALVPIKFLKEDSTAAIVGRELIEAGFTVYLQHQEDTWHLVARWEDAVAQSQGMRDDIVKLIDKLPTPKLDAVHLRETSELAGHAHEIGTLQDMRTHLRQLTADSLIRDQKEISKAQKALETLAQTAAAAAQAGHHHAIVLKFDDDSIDMPITGRKPGECKPEWLDPKSAANLVYTRCLESGLDTKIEFWHSDSTFECGFAVVVNW